MANELIWLNNRIVNIIKTRYIHSSVLVGFRHGFERY